MVIAAGGSGRGQHRVRLSFPPTQPCSGSPGGYLIAGEDSIAMGRGWWRAKERGGGGPALDGYGVGSFDCSELTFEVQPPLLGQQEPDLPSPPSSAHPQG